MFGPEEAFEVSLGYHVATFEIGGYRPRDELVYISHGVPGRQVSRFSMRDDKTLFLFVFRDEYLTAGSLRPSQSEGGAEECLAGVGWECPQILAAMGEIGDIYFDRVSQIRMERWRRAARHLSAMPRPASPSWPEKARDWRWPRRTCWRASFAIAGAIMARPSPATGADDAVPEASRESAAKFASSFAPKTAFGLTFRDVVTRLLRLPFVLDFLFGRELRDEINLPDYGF